jgi:hypothetical protein
MAGTSGASAREEVRRVELYVTQDAVNAALIEAYGSPLPPLTMDEIQTTILNKELAGEFVSSSNSTMPSIGESEFIGKLSGSMEIFHGGSDTEIFHFTEFSGAFSGSLEIFVPSNAQMYPVIDWGCSTANYANTLHRDFKGHFKYVKGGASYMSASVGANGHKTITGSFPSTYWTSSGVVAQDINDLSQSLFSGSFKLASGSINSADFYTCNGSDYRLISGHGNSSGSLFGDKYCSLRANTNVAFSLGSADRHLMIGGKFTNSASLNVTSGVTGQNIQGSNVALITNIVIGNVFTTSGSISGSLESLSDGEFIDRSPGQSTSGNYYAKTQGTDSNGKPKKKKKIIGAKNRVEIKTKRDALASKIGTSTGRPVTKF